MNHSKVSLNNVVKNIRSNYYITPDFKGRRSFVWDVLDVEKLGDSIIRNVPITSIVIMPTGGSDFSTKSLNTHSVLPPQQYIIDGHQRLSSISNIFLSTDCTFLYYFDMLAILNERFFRAKESNSSFAAYMTSQTKIESISDVLCKSFSQTEPAQATKRFVLATSVISHKFSRKVVEFLNELKENHIFETEEEYDLALDYLTCTFSSVGHYDIAMTNLSAGTSENFVKRTYEKLNLPLFS